MIGFLALCLPDHDPHYYCMNTALHHRSVARLRGGALGIVLYLDTRTIVYTGGGLRALQPGDVTECPAVCPTCRQSQWYWEVSLTPKCRTCDPLSPEWEAGLLGRALAALQICRDEAAFMVHARTVLERDFQDWRLDRLLTCAGHHALHEHVTKRKERT